MKQEHVLSCQVARYLRMRGYITLDTDVMSALRYLNPNDKRRVLYINAHTSSGYTKGQSDLVVLSPNGKTTYMELKNGKAGKQSDSQKIFQAEVERRGGEYVVIRNLDDIKNFVGSSSHQALKQSLTAPAFTEEDELMGDARLNLPPLPRKG